MARPLLVSFISGSIGPWRIERLDAVRGESLQPAERLEVLEGSESDLTGSFVWSLRGFTSNSRYTTSSETEALNAKQRGLNCRRATRAALIPIRKIAAWWDLSQNERRDIFEEQSKHIRIGLEYPPAITRRLHHCRDLGEPFDFLTWFEYAPEHADAFDELVHRLRETREWQYVDREVDIRLIRE
ncbi:chlorite dismutase family protein [Granulicella sp. S190]|uniref:chlorite dismutase family protein n=1 Tax=Granulicella sp. S190 TaxID=1747226 RepID=UPI00131E61D2|nr:chlorite dismutase family protein [Granulicella sp. S190]